MSLQSDFLAIAQQGGRAAMVTVVEGEPLGAKLLIRADGETSGSLGSAELDTRAIGPDLIANVKGVTGVHHVHVWSITQARRMVTLHACIADGADADLAVRGIKARLKERFGLDHATVEIERGACADAEG